VRLSPRVRIGPSLAAIGAAQFLARRFGEATRTLLVAIQEDPSRPASYRYLAACYAHLGRVDDAQKVVEQLRGITPRVVGDADFLRKEEHRELFLSGLRLAAGELV
jgi:predicted Zn-dependent protease